MTTNGESKASFQIVFGLTNYEGKYLTAEKFGNQINVTGISLRAKQMWIFEQESDSKGYLRSPQNNYLETNKHGDVICESDEKNIKFVFEVVINEDGKWSFRDVFGKYLAGNVERLYTTREQKISNDALWAIHMAAHPQCNMKSVSRKQYVHLQENEFRANEDIPWGHDAVITVEFREGKYALRDSTGRYLDGLTGELEKSCTKDCIFVLSVHENLFAFRASNKKYLTVYGPKGRLVASRGSVGKDEVFSLEESKAQCVLTASNNKKVSIRQGIDVTANQFMEPEDTETFQIGYHQGKRDKVTFLCRNKKYWIATEKSITATADKVSPNCVFQMDWTDNKISLKAFNGKYVASTSGGQLAPTSDSSSEANTLFVFDLVNRPILALRGEHGYIGLSNLSAKLQCNRGTHDAMQVTNENGHYKLKTAAGTSWKVGSDCSLTTDSTNADVFIFELYSKNKMRIRAPNGKYLTGDHNGAITATSMQDSSNTLWQY